MMSFRKIERGIVRAISQKKPLEIYYSETENSPEGWRKIIPHSVTTDIPPNGETLVVEKEPLSPGHILNAHDEGKKEEVKSFIIGKIKKIKEVN